MTSTDSRQLDLVGRIMHFHPIEPHYAWIALNITVEEAPALMVIPRCFGDRNRERLERFLNFLIRVEWKFKISAEIRPALELPRDESPAQILRGTDQGVHFLRDADDTITARKTKWLRVGL